MAINWKTPAELPEVTCLTGVVVAGIDREDGIGPWLRGLYVLHPNGRLVDELSGFEATGEFWWCFEDEVLEGLPC